MSQENSIKKDPNQLIEVIKDFLKRKKIIKGELKYTIKKRIN